MTKKLFIGVVTVVTSCVVALNPPAFAVANPNSNGANGQGQAQADDACFNNVHKQFGLDLDTGGGPKDGWGPPTNCDHFYQAIGAIGNG
jgi:hypothetical protein